MFDTGMLELLVRHLETLYMTVVSTLYIVWPALVWYYA